MEGKSSAENVLGIGGIFFLYLYFIYLLCNFIFYFIKFEESTVPASFSTPISMLKHPSLSNKKEKQTGKKHTDKA